MPDTGNLAKDSVLVNSWKAVEKLGRKTVRVKRAGSLLSCNVKAILIKSHWYDQANMS